MKQYIFRQSTTAIFWVIFFAAICSIEKTSCQSLSLPDKTFGDAAEKITTDEIFDADEDEIFALVNDERQKQHLDVLIRDNQLAEIARDYSQQMADENFFDHFDSRGADVVVRVKKSNLRRWSKIGENLFSVEGLSDFDHFAVENWMKSPTHRQNILDRDFNTAGIGIAESGTGEIFITEVFIKR